LGGKEKKKRNLLLFASFEEKKIFFFNYYLDDGGNRELHDTEVVCVLVGRDGARLDEELIDTDETEDVAGGAVLNGLSDTAHHEHGALDGLDVEVVLLAGDVVGALDADLLAGLDDAGEDTAESVEAALVVGGDHLRDVHHEGTVGVALADTLGALFFFFLSFFYLF